MNILQYNPVNIFCFILFISTLSCDTDIDEGMKEMGLDASKNLHTISTMEDENKVSFVSDEHTKKFCWILEQAKVPYKIVNINGKIWITWAEEFSKSVEILRKRDYEKNNIGKYHIALDLGDYELGIKIRFFSQLVGGINEI